MAQPSWQAAHLATHGDWAILLDGSGRQETVAGLNVPRTGHAERAGVLAGGMAGFLRRGCDLPEGMGTSDADSAGAFSLTCRDHVLTLNRRRNRLGAAYFCLTHEPLWCRGGRGIPLGAEAAASLRSWQRCSLQRFRVILSSCSASCSHQTDVGGCCAEGAGHGARAAPEAGAVRGHR